MTHLTPEQLVNVAEGARAESPVAHVRTCDACRRQIAELEALRAMAANVGEVPEPSPLFWDHFSARVRDVIAAEEPRRLAWWRPSAWPWLAFPVGAGVCVALALAFVLTWRLMPLPAPVPAPVEASLLEPAIDDPSLNLVADLAAQMDWDAVSELGAPLHAGAADEAIADLSATERRELRRLLQELARPGA
jgi:hypothetical protein